MTGADQTSLFDELEVCRICGSDDVTDFFSLGDHALSGCFPGPGEPDPPVVPLTLCRCDVCGLVQLRHSTDPSRMFTHDYGYRSALNASMATHLGELVEWAVARRPLGADDVVLDIGCNDGTLLKAYSTPGLVRFGIDPIVEKFAEHYPPDIKVREAFFSADTCDHLLEGRKARLITSISMFYDLPAPQDFANAIAKSLADEGVWVLEQSYLPTMLERNAFDTICHEHLEYYALAQIEWLCAKAGLRVFDAALNDCNGGSFRLAVCKESAEFRTNEEAIGALRRREAQMELNTDKPFAAFVDRIREMREEAKAFLGAEAKKGKRIFLYGASTKGNTLLQYYGLDASQIIGAAEVNPEKFGHRTPRTNIPIVDEAGIMAENPDYFLVLPWHFRDGILARAADYRAAGIKFIFPMPRFEVV